MAIAEQTAQVRQDFADIKKNATYSIPVNIWIWLKDEAARRNTDASALIVDLIRAEQEKQAA